MFKIVMPPHVRGRARARLAGRARGHTQGCTGTYGRGVEASSSSSAHGDIFGGVPGKLNSFIRWMRP